MPNEHDKHTVRLKLPPQEFCSLGKDSGLCISHTGKPFIVWNGKEIHEERIVIPVGIDTWWMEIARLMEIAKAVQDRCSKNPTKIMEGKVERASAKMWEAKGECLKWQKSRSYRSAL